MEFDVGAGSPALNFKWNCNDNSNSSASRKLIDRGIVEIEKRTKMVVNA